MELKKVINEGLIIFFIVCFDDFLLMEPIKEKARGQFASITIKLLNMRNSWLFSACFAVIMISSCKKSGGSDDDDGGGGGGGFPPPPPTGQKDIAAVDDAVKNFMLKYKIPGVSIAVTKDDKLVYVKSYGQMSEADNTPITNNSLFRIASVSKPITGVGIMKLL